MKLSQLTDGEALSNEALIEIFYNEADREMPEADVALVLGTRPEECRGRAAGAAELYRAGRVGYLAVTGGVLWEDGDRRITEAELMRERLMELGVPEDRIILENQARTTKENYLFGAVEINRALRFERVRRVCVVTSGRHLRRSMALAEWLLPRHMELCGYRSDERPTVEGLSAEARADLVRELKLMQGLVKNGLIADEEI